MVDKALRIAGLGWIDVLLQPWEWLVLLTILALERLMPLVRDQAVLRRRWADDGLYLLINPILIALVITGLMAVVLAPLKSLVPAAVPAFVAGLPLWVQVPLALVVAELGFYTMHRLFHAVPLLWRFHSIHHSIEELDWLAAHRVHPIDQALTAGASVLPLLLLGFSPAAMGLWGITYFVQSHLIHANIALRLGGLEHVLASPHYHHWHHARGAPPANFGAQLVFMDQLFGTLHRPPAMPPGGYGIDEKVPELLPLALLWPLRRPTAAATHPTGADT
jgi:sterol desaturase/sphingolipid hydroxylase (fatty acid hydroxylase superfamily)